MDACTCEDAHASISSYMLLAAFDFARILSPRGTAALARFL